jgi:hypothetical protein
MLRRESKHNNSELETEQTKKLIVVCYSFRNTEWFQTTGTGMDFTLFFGKRLSILEIL